MTFLSYAYPIGPCGPIKRLKASFYLRLKYFHPLSLLLNTFLADRQGMYDYMSQVDVYILIWLIHQSHLENKFRFCQPEPHSRLL